MTSWKPGARPAHLLVVILFTLALAVGCGDSGSSGSSMDKAALDRLAMFAGRNMIQGAFFNFNVITERGTLSKTTFRNGLARLRRVADDSTDAFTYQDTSYYDPATGFWFYGYQDEWGSWEMTYRYEPHDSEGMSTDETESMECTMKSSGRYGDSEIVDRWIYSSESAYRITGLKNWNDPDVDGEIVYEGASKYTYAEKFTEDTTVTVSFASADNDIRMKENGCMPYRGRMTFTSVQDATPDYFYRDFDIWMGIACDSSMGCENNGTYRIEYSDVTMKGAAIFEKNGVRYILDGEEYFYEVDCDNMEVRMADH